ncbi:MAG: XTP/dITP diphosphatase [Oscillospiraceae bacterium]|nr:XTP/dITP diphosphatase [Oscillospiraceae bacterium]
MNKIIIASNNKGKVEEIKKIFNKYEIEILSLGDLNIDIDIEETGQTFEENAYIKAKAIYDLVKLPTIADDSGLCVEYLGGRPGVLSARYAGEGATDQDRINKLLDEMKDAEKNKRNAKFVSSIVFIINKKQVLKSTGECFGTIALEPRGSGGFGYDPIFLINNNKTVAQLSQEEKNKISHRAMALKNLEKLLEMRVNIDEYHK